MCEDKENISCVIEKWNISCVIVKREHFMWVN